MSSLEERRKALEKKFVENRPPLAYAKLCGRLADDAPFEMLITHLPVELGRGAVSTVPGARIALGEQKAISRQHAKIQWNQDKSCFELQCLGKNGVFAGGKIVPKDKIVELASKTPLKIGPVRIYFVAAIRSTCSTMSGFKLVQRAFEKVKHTNKVSTGLTVNELVQTILEMFPKSEAELGGKDNLRTFIANYVSEDTASFEKDASSDPPRYKILPNAIGAFSSMGPPSLGKVALAGRDADTMEAPLKKARTVGP